jgi:phosphoenolpyruvate-protein phosphotransferase
MAMYKGLAISPGVVVASAYCLDEVVGRPGPATPGEVDLSRELAGFEQACDAVGRSLQELIDKTAKEVGERESSIFRAHLLMLRDRAFTGRVRALIIEQGRDAASALREVLADYENLFANIRDDYLRERIVDLRDLAARIQRELGLASPVQPVNLASPVILVARELFPSQTIGLDKLKIAGIVTERGGATGHAAIIARSMGIPAVSGIPDVCSRIKTTDLLALDGREGHVIVNPGPEAEAAFRKLQREFFDLQHYLIENRDQPAVTKDGVAIDLLANINNVSDAKAAVEVGAVGIGLFRTEYIFMTHPSIPSEEDQVQVYKQILEASPERRLTIRTLDLGGDKTVPYLGDHRESNPFMGWRSIRLSFDHPELFRKQVRAILRAGAEPGKVRILFPMITNVEELRRANRAVWRVREELKDQGVPYGADVELGFMLEVPAAALCLEQLVRHTDFVTVGTNDLIQYLMAADRDNPKVAHLCDPLSPAVLGLLKQSAEICRAAKKPVSVCGEMAGRPRCVLALMAFGFRSFSMSPAFVPIVKELIHSLKHSDLASIAADCLKRRTAGQVRNFLHRTLEEISPRLAQLESVRQ